MLTGLELLHRGKIACVRKFKTLFAKNEMFTFALFLALAVSFCLSSVADWLPACLDVVMDLRAALHVMEDAISPIQDQVQPMVVSYTETVAHTDDMAHMVN